MFEQAKLLNLLRDPVAKEERLAKILEIEDRIADKANQVIDAIVHFGEIDPEQAEPPIEWEHMYGAEGAKQRFRVMQASWLPAKEAPVALRLVTQVKVGIDRARAHKVETQNNTINVQMLTLPAPTSVEHPGKTHYAVIDVDSE